MANVAGDDLLLLEGLRDTECVVDHCLLDWVHLREGKRRKIREKISFSVQQSSSAAEERSGCQDSV